MSIDIADVCRLRPGPRQCSCHAQAGAVPGRLRAHHVVGVAGRAIAPHLHAPIVESQQRNQRKCASLYLPGLAARNASNCA